MLWISYFYYTDIAGSIFLLQIYFAQISDFIKPIVFARSSEPNHVSDAVTITGWGRTSDGTK